MKSTRLSQDYLQDILDAMDKAEEFIGTMNCQEFMEDNKTAYAVIRCFEIIGEAAKKISPSLRKRYPAIPWKNLTGMRDKLIHDYIGVSFEMVWRTVKEDIPAVKQLLIAMLETVREKENK